MTTVFGYNMLGKTFYGKINKFAFIKMSPLK